MRGYSVVLTYEDLPSAEQMFSPAEWARENTPSCTVGGMTRITRVTYNFTDEGEAALFKLFWAAE